MLPKTPKSSTWKFIKGSAKIIFVAEVIGFAVSYGVYHRMNTSREFRLYVNENFPFALDYYYKIGETFGNNNQRQIDSTYWRAQAKKED